MSLTECTGIPLYEAELAAQIWKNGWRTDQEKFWTMRELGDSGTDTAGLGDDRESEGEVCWAQGNGLMARKGSGVSTS